MTPYWHDIVDAGRELDWNRDAHSNIGGHPAMVDFVHDDLAK